MAKSVSVQGDTATAARLQRVGQRATTQRQVLAQVARATAQHITGVPVGETGKLADSIGPLWVTDRSFAVGSRVPYARHVFHGTRYMDPQPPRVPPDIDVIAARAMAQDIVS